MTPAPRTASAGVLAMAAVFLMTGSAGAARAPGVGPAAARATAASWPVYHQNLAGSGVAPSVAAVNTRTRAWTSPRLDGDIYGEPLVSDRRVFVATENDTVYALSATTGKPVWSRHLARAVPAGALPCGDIGPTVGITGTPVIDQRRREIFVVADEFVRGRPAHVLVGLGTGSGRVERTGTGGGPPIIAAGLVWTIGNGILYGLNPANGRVRQHASIGAQANDFPTPSVGDGLLLAPDARHIVAFRASTS